MLKIRTVECPFTLRGQKEWDVRKIPFKSFAHYRPAAFADSGCIVNGRPLGEQAVEVGIPRDGDEIIFVKHQRVFPASLSFWQLVTITLIANIIGAVIGFVVSFLIPKPEAPKNNAGTAYAWNGIQTTANAGLPIPIVYGRHLVGGNIIQAFTRSSDFGTSRLYMVVALCRGKIHSIGQYDSDRDRLDGTAGKAFPDGMKLNGKPIGEFKGVKVSTRLGSFEQDPIPGLASQAIFGDARNYKFAIDAVNADEEVPYAHSDWVTIDNDQYDADSFELNLYWPQGFGKTNHAGEYKAITIQYEVQFRANGASGDWTPCGTLTLEKKFRGQPTYTFGSYDYLNFPTRGKYDVRVRQINLFNHVNGPIEDGGTSYFYSFTEITSINWILEEQIAYRGTALVALEAVASDQLSGGIPQLKTLIDGLEVKTFDAVSGEWGDEVYTNNAAWVAAAWAVDEADGSGAYFSLDENDAARPFRLDTDMFVEWAEYCEEEGLLFNGIFDGLNNSAWDILKQIFAVGHAKLVLSGTYLTPMVESPRTHVQIFNMANIRNYKRIHLERQDRANVIGLQFLNAEKDYERDEMQYEDPARPPTEPYRKQSIQMPGITDPNQAYRECRFYTNGNRLVKCAHEWESSIYAITCKPGNVVLLQHRLIRGVFGGRCLSGGGSTTIKLDQDIIIPSGETWHVKVQHLTDDTQETRIISSPAGTYNANTALSITEAWEAVPAAGDIFLIGNAETISVPVIINKITRSGDFTRKIEAIDYTDELYEQSGTPTYPSGGTGTSIATIGTPFEPAIGDTPVTIEQPTDIYVETFLRNGEPVVEVSIATGTPAPFYELWTRRSGTTEWDYYGLTSQPAYTITGLDAGTEYTIAAVAISQNGIKVAPDQGAFATVHTGVIQQAQRTGTPTPDELNVEQIGDIVRVWWEAQDDIDHYVLRRGYTLDWANAKTVYVGDDAYYETREWVPTIGDTAVETWMLRVFGKDGLFSNVVRTDAALYVPISDFQNPTLQIDYGDGGWADGTLTNIEDDGSGNLVLSAGQTSGTFVTDVIALDYKRWMHPQVLVVADRINEMPLGYRIGTLSSRMWAAWSLSGPLDTEVPSQLQDWPTLGEMGAKTLAEMTTVCGRVSVAMRFSDDNITWSNWETYRNMWVERRYAQFKATLETGHTHFKPRLRGLHISIGEKPVY
jgi:predicted phage tail protein